MTFNVLTETDPRLKVTTYTYDANGFKTSMKDRTGGLWSATYNATGGPVTVTNPLNPNLDWGPGANDRRHALVASGAYQLPFGLVASGIWTVRSSQPFSAYSGAVNIDSTRQYVPGTTRNQINRDVDFNVINTFRTARGLSTLSSSTVQNSSYNSFDFRLLESIKLGESRRLELYGQAFNLFGRVNYTNSSITTSAAASTFGRASAASNLQQGEFAARFIF